MKKIIYHGSKEIVKEPIFGFGKKTNDYGLGFYCTESLDLAYEWAVDLFNDGYANKYEIDFTGLKILRLDKEEYSVLHWLTILLQNRTFAVNNPLANEARDYLIKNFSLPYRDYDIIIGYRADDSYFSFAQDFISGTISLQQLAKAMKLGNLGKQVVLISEKAFNKLHFVEAIEASSSIYYVKKEMRDKKARNDYLNTRKIKRNKDDLFINQIIDEEIKDGDTRLR